MTEDALLVLDPKLSLDTVRTLKKLSPLPVLGSRTGPSKHALQTLWDFLTGDHNQRKLERQTSESI